MPWVCPCRCGHRSRTLHRCDRCGRDLADEPHEWLDRVDPDSLVDVAVPYQCLRCGARHRVRIDYSDIGYVIRTGCPACRHVARHRPVGPDVERQVHDLELDDADRDHTPDTDTDREHDRETADLLTA